MMSLPPANECLGHGNIFAPVCHSVHRGGNTWAGTPPGRYSPPLGQVSPHQCMLGYGQQAGGTHPTGMHSCFTCQQSNVKCHLYFLHFFRKKCLRISKTLITAHQRSCGKGNVFTGICHSVQGWCSCLVPGPFWWVGVGMPGPRSFGRVCWGGGRVCINIPQTWDLGYPPLVLIPSGGHHSTYSWQAGGMHSTEMLSCLL